MALNDRGDCLSLWPSTVGLQIFAQEALRGFQSPANPFIRLPLIYGLILTVFSMQMLRVGMGCGGSGIYIM